MRVGIVDKNNRISNIIEFNGGALITCAHDIVEQILEYNGCGHYPKLSVEHIVDKSNNNNIKKSTLKEFIKIDNNEEGALYDERLVIYNNTRNTRTIFNDLDMQCESETLAQALSKPSTKTWDERITDVKCFDNIISDATPDRTSIMYNRRTDLYNAFKDLLATGYIDTSNAAVIINEYYNLSVIEKHEKYIEAYLVNNKNN